MTQKNRPIRIGTRGSLLATTQTGQIVAELQKHNPNLQFETILIKTTGDLNQKDSLLSFGGQGVFVKELENALLNNEIDIAVHSLKDVPHHMPQGLCIRTFSPRQDARDAFFSKYNSFNDLPNGSTVGTGSPRRILQLRKLRPDLKFVELRGNIDTRIKKAETGEFDAVILAAAGIHRMDWSSRIRDYFEFEQMIPAISQGVIALQTRENDDFSNQVARTINSLASEIATFLERGFMVQMGGGCKSPMAALAQIGPDQIEFSAFLAHPDGHIDLKKSSTWDYNENWDLLQKSLSQFIEEFKKEAVHLQIPLPSDLPEHHLLTHPIPM